MQAVDKSCQMKHFENVSFFFLSWILDTFTDTAISSTRVNGEHKEKVLQRWEGGDSNGESYDLENDAVSHSVSLMHRNTN